MTAKRHDSDRTIQRYLEPGALHICWPDHETEEAYGGVFYGEDVRPVLVEEGLTPDEFWPEVARP